MVEILEKAKKQLISDYERNGACALCICDYEMNFKEGLKYSMYLDIYFFPENPLIDKLYSFHPTDLISRLNWLKERIEIEKLKS